MRYIIALFFCLLFPCLSVMGQQTDSLRIDTIVDRDSSTMTLKDSLLFRLKESMGLGWLRSFPEDTLHYYTVGVGSSYARAKEDALIKTRKELRIADYEDLPTLSIVGEKLWTMGKKVYVSLHIIRVVNKNCSILREEDVVTWGHTPNIKANKLTARKKTKSEKRKDSQEFEELKFKCNEKEFRKRMEEIFKKQEDSKQ